MRTKRIVLRYTGGKGVRSELEGLGQDLSPAQSSSLAKRELDYRHLGQAHHGASALQAMKLKNGL